MIAEDHAAIAQRMRELQQDRDQGPGIAAFFQAFKERMCPPAPPRHGAITEEWMGRAPVALGRTS